VYINPPFLNIPLIVDRVNEQPEWGNNSEFNQIFSKVVLEKNQMGCEYDSNLGVLS
jgi:hypothetical protein